MSLFLLRLLGNIGYTYYLKNHLNFPTESCWQEMLDRLAQKSGFSKAIQLVESALVRTPMVAGHLKPVILFPIGMINRLDPREAEAILAYELAHILRHDYLFNILQSIVETLFYFHPAVWWLSGAIRHEPAFAGPRKNCLLSRIHDVTAGLVQGFSKLGFSKGKIEGVRLSG
jgi:beta-lactamase regulating signal transducer with metallopeptidase domain